MSWCRNIGCMDGDAESTRTDDYVGIRELALATRLADPRTGCCPESLRTNADDRLSLASLGRVEGRNGIVEARNVADVRPQSSVPHALDNLTQLGTIGLDNEVDRQAVRRPRVGRANDGHQ